MNKTNKLLAAFVVAALVFVLVPSSTVGQNAGDDYGTQVLDTDNEFRPVLEAGADIGGGTVNVLRSDGPDATTFSDDVFVLDIDDSDTITQYDYILATGGYGGSQVGNLVQAGDTALLALAETSVAGVVVVYADVNENGFYDGGDYVYITTAATGSGDLVATAVGAGAAFTIRLTPTPSGGFGSLVRTTHNDLRDYGTDGVSEDWDDFDGGVADIAEFAYYDSENDDAFDGSNEASNNDRAYIVGPGGVTAGDPVPLYSVVIFGGTLGEQVEIGGMDWSPTVMDLGLLTTLDVVRYDPGTPDNSFDDVFVLNLDGTADIDQYDLVLATQGYGGSQVGMPVSLSQTLLIGNGGAAVATEVFSADVDQNGFWNEGDYLWICDDAGTTVHRTDADEFCIRLTDTSGGDAGSLVRVGDTDLRDWQDNTDDESAAADACFFDADSDAAFDGGNDMLWIFVAGCADGDLLDLYSIVLYGGTFGMIVGLNDNNFVPSLTATTGDDSIEADDIIRYDAGTDDVFTDDVFALDLDDSGDLSLYDLIIASDSNYGGRGVGDTVQVGDELLLGNGAVVATEVLAVDVNENGVYDQGDWVYICSGADLVPTTLAAFCIRMTDTSDGNAGSIVRTADDDWDRWAGTEIDLDAAEVGFYDNDNDGAFQGEGDGDLLFLSPVAITDGSRVPLYSLRLFGDFSIVPPSSPTTTTTTTSPQPTTTTPDPTTTTPPVTTTTPPVTTTDGTQPTTTTDGTQPTTTDGTGPTTTEGGEDTPGFELVALVAALGAALILVRRRL